jgi:hypothetical protein
MKLTIKIIIITLILWIFKFIYKLITHKNYKDMKHILLYHSEFILNRYSDEMIAIYYMLIDNKDFYSYAYGYEYYISFTFTSDIDTLTIINHFSHVGFTKDEFLKIMSENLNKVIKIFDMNEKISVTIKVVRDEST